MKISSDMQRRLEILIAIDEGANTLALLNKSTDIPEPSLKRNLAKIKSDFNISIEFIRASGSNGAGHYVITDWGIINSDELRLFKINEFK